MDREPSVSHALKRTYEAGQSLIVRRIDLLVAEIQLFRRAGQAILVGALAAVLGWLYLMEGMIDGLTGRYPRFAVELGVGFAHVGLAALLFLRGRSLTAKAESGR